METQHWPGNGVKTGSYFFGYNLLEEIGSYADDKEMYKEAIKVFNQLTKRMLHLAVEGHVQLLYLNSSLMERRVVAFRFQSANAFDEHGDTLLDLGRDLDIGIWEPLRDPHQDKYWRVDIPGATLTVAFGGE